MKKLYFPSLLFLVIVAASSCGKGGGSADKPVLTTLPVSNITDNTASSGGNITSDGGSSIIGRGVLWDTSATFSSAHQVSSGTGAGSFSASLTGLLPGTNWYVRAFASNSIGTSYGNTVQFSTTFKSNGYTVTTFAGGSAKGDADGSASTAGFVGPTGVAVDPSGTVYVVESSGTGRIRKIGVDNMVTTFVYAIGSEGNDLVTDAAGNVYDLDFKKILYKITPIGGVTTFAGSGATGSADGAGTAASFITAFSMDIDESGTIYVADMKHIRKVSPDGNVTTLPVLATDTFYAVATDRSHNLYVSDGPRIKKIDASGNMTFIAGSRGSSDGMGSAAGFGSVYELRVGSDGNIYASDGFNNKIRMITPAGVVTTVAGTGNPGARDGDGAVASFSFPIGLAFDKAGNLLVVDAGNSKIRKISHN